MAVLDIGLGRETAEPIARKLKEASIPFVAISGYSHEQQPAVFNVAPFVPKQLQLSWGKKRNSYARLISNPVD